MGKLTPKQNAFVQEYLVDLNATQAAIRAGYKSKTARQIAAQNLSKLNIQTAIEEGMKEREKRTEVTQDMVIQQLAKIAFLDIKDVVTWAEGQGIKIRDSDEVDGTVLTEVSETLSEGGWTKKVKMSDRMRAIEMLGRHLGMFKDRVEHTGKDGGPIEVDDARERLLSRINRLAPTNGQGEDSS